MSASKTKRRRKRIGSRIPQSRRAWRNSTKRRRSIKISDSRLRRALMVFRETGSLSAAASSIRVSARRFRRQAINRHLIRKRAKGWAISGRLPRQMILYSNGRQLVVTLRGIRVARLVGRYLSAVRKFLRTNKPGVLKAYSGLEVKDARGATHPFETNPNVLYRLASASDQAFEQIYRIII